MPKSDRRGMMSGSASTLPIISHSTMPAAWMWRMVTQQPQPQLGALELELTVRKHVDTLVVVLAKHQLGRHPVWRKGRVYEII